jgi:type I restriction enzyme S subunit
VTSGLITKGVIREARESVTERALRETSLRLWPAGTLLVAMYGEGQTRARCAELGIEATCNQACAAVSLLESLRLYNDFVRLSFDANYAANRRLASGGVQPNLNAGLIKDMVLSLPPAEEQARIVTEVERQLSFVDACERAVDVGLARSAGLRRSVLKAAFEGRLVPQDPSDEPASVLLDRIRAERAAQPVTKRRARSTA